MAITYDAANKIMTIVGYTLAVPCNFDDLYNASVAGGWGAITRQGNRQYWIDCRLVIGNASTDTFFADESKEIVFSADAISDDSQRYIYVRTKASFRLGKVFDAANHVTENGCQVYVELNSGGWTDLFFIRCQTTATSIVEIYDSLLISDTENLSFGNLGTLTLWNSDLQYINPYYGTWDMFNVSILYGSSLLPFVSGTFNRIFGASYAYGAYATSTFAVTLKDTEFSNWVGVGGLFYGLSITADCFFINVTSPDWTMFWGGVCTKALYRQYTFDLKVTDKDNAAISGATVTLLDKNGTSIFSVNTAADGTIAQQTVSRGYYNQANGNTLQEYSPHTLTISKIGYQTYVKKFTLTQKTVWEIKLAKAAQILHDVRKGKLALNLKSIDPDNIEIMMI